MLDRQGELEKCKIKFPNNGTFSHYKVSDVTLNPDGSLTMALEKVPTSFRCLCCNREVCRSRTRIGGVAPGMVKVVYPESRGPFFGDSDHS